MEQNPTARSSRVADPQETLDRALAGDRRSLARLISAVEERSDAAVAIGRRLAPLARTAHAYGITDVEYEAQQKELARLARLEKILEDVRNSDEPAEMPEVHRNHEEPTWSEADDYDYGYHDQWD